MDTVPLSAQKVLDTFFTDAPVVRHPSMRSWGAHTHSLLESFLEASGEDLMTEPESVLLAAERQLEPHGAVLRTLSPRALLAALPGFLTRPWWPSDVREASARVQIVAALRTWVLTLDPLSAEPTAMRRMDDALAAAHSHLARTRRTSGQR